MATSFSSGGSLPPASHSPPEISLANAVRSCRYLGMPCCRKLPRLGLAALFFLVWSFMACSSIHRAGSLHC